MNIKSLSSIPKSKDNFIGKEKQTLNSTQSYSDNILYEAESEQKFLLEVGRCCNQEQNIPGVLILPDAG